MIKLTYLREEDYWLFPLSFVCAFALMATIYISTFSMRAPAAILGFGLLWFTTLKVRDGYDGARAWVHATTLVISSVLLFFVLHTLTN